MNFNIRDRGNQPDRPSESNPPRWRLWLTQITIFSVVFVFVLTLFSMLGEIVEEFFLTLYVD